MLQVAMDDQPVSSRFFGEGKFISEFITPNALEVQSLHAQLTENLTDLYERIQACWYWVASEVRYTKFVSGVLQVEGMIRRQNDLWCDPSLTIRTRVGNCANKAFLLTSLLRRELQQHLVYCALGNLHDNGSAGGHAWVQLRIDGADYVMESTRADIPSLVPVTAADRYEVVHLFNDQEAFYIEGKTQMEPFTAAYSNWLKDYLDWAYIEGGGQK